MDKRAEWDKAIMGLNRLFLDDFRAAKTALLDALENIDEAHAVPGGIVPAVMTDKEAAEFAEQWMENFRGGQPVVPAEPRTPTDAEITTWIRVHEREFEAWVRKQARINGSGVQQVMGTAPTEQAAAPARPAPRRRTTR